MDVKEITRLHKRRAVALRKKIALLSIEQRMSAAAAAQDERLGEISRAINGCGGILLENAVQVMVSHSDMSKPDAMVWLTDMLWKIPFCIPAANAVYLDQRQAWGLAATAGVLESHPLGGEHEKNLSALRMAEKMLIQLREAPLGGTYNVDSLEVEISRLSGRIKRLRNDLLNTGRSNDKTPTKQSQRENALRIFAQKRGDPKLITTVSQKNYWILLSKEYPNLFPPRGVSSIESFFSKQGIVKFKRGR
jgi:hypothetical protein